MEIKKYTPVPKEVEAVLINKNNIEEAAKWCGGTVTDSEVRYISVNGLFRGKAYIGDFLVKDANGNFRVYMQKQFLANHEEVKDEEKSAIVNIVYNGEQARRFRDILRPRLR